MKCNAIKLNNGREIPVIGLGTCLVSPKNVKRAILDAIDVGYRHFDCAWVYGNEAEIGEALQDAISSGKVKREDLFITSKLWNNFHKKEKVVPTLKKTLASLKLNYVDLYLVHWPFAFKEDGNVYPVNEGSKAYSDVDYLETWKEMEECVKQGLAKSIGISNFNSEQIDRLLENCVIKPAINQIEVNAKINQKKLIQFCKERDIVVTGYSPLEKANPASEPLPTIFDPKVAEIGNKYNKSPAQVILNYLISLGIVIVPKTVTKSRMEENLNILDFQLDSADIEYMDLCNENYRSCSLSMFKDHKYYPFNIKF